MDKESKLEEEILASFERGEFRFMNAKYSGQCLCGEINYSVDIEPVFTGNCHCNDCQRSSGSAFIPVMIFPEKDVAVSGEVKYFESLAGSGNTH